MRFLPVLAFLLLAASCRAVIVSGGDGTGNTSGAGVVGWDYVGALNGASGVYLGSYGGSDWVLTAGHVGAGAFTLNNVTYAPAGPAISLTNPDNTPADLVLFRISGGPGLTTLTLSSRTPRVLTAVTMIGNGIGREASETVGLGGIYAGYHWKDPFAKRWGSNTVVGTTSVTYTGSTVTTSVFYTQFSNVAGSAQATSGDSGGGVFTANGTLAGIMIAVGPLSGQPENTSVYGENTYIADIKAYRSQILDLVSAAPVPEPAVTGLLLGGLAFVAGRIRTRRAVPR